MSNKKPNTVSFGSFVDPEMAQEQSSLDNSRALAKALMSAGMTPLDTNRQYATSPLEAIGKLAQVLAGTKIQKSNDERELNLATRQREALVQALSGQSSANGEPGDQEPFGINNLMKGKAIEALGGNSAAGAYWDNAKDTPDIKNWKAQGVDPKELGQFLRGEQRSKSLMSVPQGNTIYDPLTGQTGFSSPKLAEGQVYQNGQVFNAPGAVKSVAEMEGVKAGAKAGAEAAYKPFYVETPSGERLLTNEGSASQAQGVFAPSQAMKSASEKLNVGIADKLIESGHKATEAVKTINIINRLKNSVDSGNIISGPGADARLVLSQISNVMGIQGKDDKEKLLNTRTAIQGLSQMALNSASVMKGSGSVSDFERKLLDRASSGDISSMTQQEISMLLNIYDRSAREIIQTNNNIADEMKDKPEFAGMVRHYKVEMPQSYSAKSSGTSTKAISSQKEYDALPSGSTYISPDGKLRRKK